MATIITKQAIIDNYMTTVENGAGNMNRIHAAVEENLDKSGLPGVAHKRDQVASSMFGSSREMIIVTHQYLRKYKIFLCARDYGQHLDCARFLTCKQPMFKKIGRDHAHNLSVFSHQELSAWGHCVHNAFIKAIQDLMGDLEQDITHMNTHSKGYLSDW